MSRLAHRHALLCALLLHMSGCGSPEESLPSDAAAAPADVPAPPPADADPVLDASVSEDAPADVPEPEDVGPEDVSAPDAPPPADAEAAVEEVAPDIAVVPDEDAPAACPTPRPILLVHGINGSSDNYAVMVQRLIDEGQPKSLIFLFDAVDPSWTCNVDNAAAIDVLVKKILADTGFARIDLIAHSMGTISTRYWLKFMGGTQWVNTYVTLGGMHHGLFSPCLAPEFLGVCVWQELCETGKFIAALNADPATPGALHWVSMMGTADTTVPNASSTLEGAENIVFEGVEHSGPKGLLEVPEVFAEVLRVLAYPCW